MTIRALRTTVILMLSSTSLFSLPAAAAEIQLKTRTGATFGGYVAGPEDAQSGILLFHD